MENVTMTHFEKTEYIPISFQKVSSSADVNSDFALANSEHHCEQLHSILKLVLSFWANELPSKSLQNLYGLQNKAFQQTSELLTFSSQINLIFSRLFKSHYAEGNTQDPSLSPCLSVKGSVLIED